MNNSNDMDNESKLSFLSLTTEIVSAYLSNNSLDVFQIPDLIQQVFNKISTVANTVSNNTQKDPAVHPKKSVTPGYLICLEDGEKLKMLKRHLRTAYNMTPDEYRQRWNLPPDYPMVAPNYAATRSALAKECGLGRSKNASDAMAKNAGDTMAKAKGMTATTNSRNNTTGVAA